MLIEGRPVLPLGPTLVIWYRRQMDGQRAIAEVRPVAEVGDAIEDDGPLPLEPHLVHVRVELARGIYRARRYHGEPVGPPRRHARRVVGGNNVRVDRKKD